MYITAYIAYVTRWSDIYGAGVTYITYLSFQRSPIVICFRKNVQSSRKRGEMQWKLYGVTYIAYKRILGSFTIWPPD